MMRLRMYQHTPKKMGRVMVTIADRVDFLHAEKAKTKHERRVRVNGLDERANESTETCFKGASLDSIKPR
jgi:hypothetical protein